MPRYVLDFTILLELADPHSAWKEAARQTIDDIQRQGHTCVAFDHGYAQLWSTLTRPAMMNGHDLSPEEARAAIDALRAEFQPLGASVGDHWLDVATENGLVGNDVHVARMLAAMKASGATHLLTASPPVLPARSGIEVVLFDPAVTA